MRNQQSLRLLAVTAAIGLMITACGGAADVDAGPEAASPSTDPATETEEAGGESVVEPSESTTADEGDPAVTEAVEVDDPAPRLLVADATEPVTTLLDLTTGEVLERYEHASPARLYATPDRRFALVSQYDAGLVEILDAGVWTDWHGDHGHHYVAPPSLLAHTLEGERPAHVHVHRGEATVFFDGLGSATTLDLNTFTDDAPAEDAVTTSAPHHGVVVPAPGGYVVTVPDAASPQDLPRGVQVRAQDGTVVTETPDCGEIHGEALVGDDVVFACEDGLLVVAFDADGPSFSFVPYPEDADPTARIWTLIGGDGFVVGELYTPTFGLAGVLIHELQTGTTTVIDVPQGHLPLTLGIDHTGSGLTSVDADGTLHLIDLDSGGSTGSVQVADPVDLPAGVEGLGAPKPTVRSIAGDTAYVSDPAAGTVVELDLGSLEVGRRLDVGGTPAFAVVLGQEARAGASGA